MEDKNIKLRPEVKAEWLRRLRSGELPQGTGALKRILRRDTPLNSEDGNPVFGYCCLGVLSHMYVEQNNTELGRVSWGEPNEVSGVCTLFTPGYSEQAIPTSSVIAWAYKTELDIDRDDYWIVHVDKEDAEKYDAYVSDSGTIYLPSANDRGLAFEYIADLIEKYL